MHTFGLFVCVFLVFLAAVWLWALTDVGQRVDWSHRARIFWAMSLVFLPFTSPLYSTFLAHSGGLRRFCISGTVAGLVLGGWATSSAWRELRGEFQGHMKRLQAQGGAPPLDLGGLLSMGPPPPPGDAPAATRAPRPPAGSRNAVEPVGILDPAKPPEVVRGRRPTPPDPPTPRPTSPGLPSRAFPAADWSPKDLHVLAFTGARPRWASASLDGSLVDLGRPLAAGVRVHTTEVGGGAAWVIWKDRLCLVDASGGDPLPLPAPEDLPPVLYPRDLTWLPGMGALLVLARNGGFYMQPSDDATPARWRHMGAFARRDLRALVFDPGSGRLFGLVQHQDQLVALVRLKVSGEVAEEVPLAPPLPSSLRTDPGDLQLRWAAGGLLLLRPEPAVAGGAPPEVTTRWIDPTSGQVYRPVQE